MRIDDVMLVSLHEYGRGGVMKYSIVIPVYNSAESIAEVVKQIKNTLEDEKEIILINDGSVDESRTGA